MTAVEPQRLPDGAAARNSGLADVIDVLIRLHDREADPGLLAGLRDHDVARWIGENLSSPGGQAAAGALRDALEELPSPMTESVLDDLAVEFADIYLTNGYRISPSGSVWLTDDHLERQAPMFEVRDWYAHYDISVPDWRSRADDHLVHEFQFLAFLLRRNSPVAVQDAARFMDLHMLPWIPEFCRTGRPRLRCALYRALFDLTEAVLDEARSTLEAQTGTGRDVRPLPGAAPSRAPDAEGAYLPGVSESW